MLYWCKKESRACLCYRTVIAMQYKTILSERRILSAHNFNNNCKYEEGAAVRICWKRTLTSDGSHRFGQVHLLEPPPLLLQSFAGDFFVAYRNQPPLLQSLVGDL